MCSGLWPVLSPLPPGGADPWGAQGGPFHPLVLVTQVRARQNRAFLQPLAWGQGGAFGSGPRNSVPRLEVGLPLSCRV